MCSAPAPRAHRRGPTSRPVANFYAGAFLIAACGATALATAPTPLRVNDAGGAPRAWSMGIPITKFSTVDPVTMNVHSRVVLSAGWRGKGPAMPPLVLYHSSMAATSGDTMVATAGFNLGAGWTATFCGSTDTPSGNVRRVLEDDGTVNTFTWNSSVWLPPGGVYDRLEADGGGFRVTRKDASYRKYASNGELTAIGDAAGLEIVIAYAVVSDNRRINTVTDASGRVITFNYDGSVATKLNSITLPLDGYSTRTWAFAYDGGRLSEITTPEEHVIGIAYDGSGRISGITDQNSNSATIDYDGTITVTDPAPFDDQTQVIDCNTSSLVTTYTDRRQNEWAYEFNAGGELTSVTDPLSHVRAWSYDNGGQHQREKFTDANSHIWTYAYGDGRGNVTSITDPLSNVTTMTYDATYNKLTERVDPDEADPSRRVWTWVIDATTNGHPGNLLSESDPLYGVGGSPILTTYTYYTDGEHSGKWTHLLKTRTDRRGVVTAFEYDDYGQLAKITVDANTSGLNLITQYETDLAGRRTAMIDPRGVRTEYSHDNDGRMIQVVADAGTNGLNLTTDYDYDPAGNRISVIKPGNSTGRTETRYDFDELDRLVRITEGYGVEDFGFETAFDYDENGNRIGQTDACEHETAWAFDEANRNISMTDANSNTTAYEYDPAGNRTAVVDANTHRTEFEYDDINRMITKTVDPGDLALTTQYSYSVSGGGGCGCGGTAGKGQIRRIIDAENKYTYYKYDLLDRRTEVILKDANTSDEADASDAVTQTGFDEEGHVVSVVVLNDAGTSGHPDLLTTSTYDNAGRLSSRTVDPNGLALATLYTYDENGNVLTTTPPNGNVITNTWDHANRRTATVDSVGDVEAVEYDDNGNVVLRTNGAGESVVYEYDALDRRVSAMDDLSQATVYAYNEVGKPVEITDANARKIVTKPACRTQPASPGRSALTCLPVLSSLKPIAVERFQSSLERGHGGADARLAGSPDGGL